MVQAREHLSLQDQTTNYKVVKQQIDELEVVLTLQDIVYNQIRGCDTQEDVVRLVSEVAKFDMLEGFIFDNENYLLQVLVLDYRYFLRMVRIIRN